MAYEKKDLTGAVFKNTDKTEEWHPEYKGDCLIDGTEYYVDCKIKESETGRKYMTLKFKAKKASAQKPKQKTIDESDVPF